MVKGLPRWLSRMESTRQWRRCKRCRFDLWIGKILWRRKWQPTSGFLFGKAHGQRSLLGYCLGGHKEPDITEQLNNNKSWWKALSIFTENLICPGHHPHAECFICFSFFPPKSLKRSIHASNKLTQVEVLRSLRPWGWALRSSLACHLAEQKEAVTMHHGEESGGCITTCSITRLYSPVTGGPPHPTPSPESHSSVTGLAPSSVPCLPILDFTAQCLEKHNPSCTRLSILKEFSFQCYFQETGNCVVQLVLFSINCFGGNDSLLYTRRGIYILQGMDPGQVCSNIGVWVI